MGRKMLKKLRSRKGASLTFALLAFLVCAVISAVLLASASAAAGRASGLADMDQRYYAVTSAAQLFCDTLANDKAYTFTRTYTENNIKELKYVYKTSESGSGFELANPHALDADPVIESQSYELEFAIKDKTNGDPLSVPVKIKSSEESRNVKTRIANPDFLTEIALYYIFGDYNKDVDNLLGTSDAIRHENTWEMTLTVGGTTSPIASLTVDVTAKLDKSGNVVISFTNHEDETLADAKKKKYSVSVTLGATIDDDSMNPAVKSRSLTNIEWDDDTTYRKVIRTKVEKTKTTAISWSVTSVSKAAEVGSSGGSGDSGSGGSGDNDNEGGGQSEP